jgi:hypothetical protein
MADLAGFDANKVDPSTNYEPLPAGQYVAVISASEQKTTKAGDGQYLQLTFEIIEGPHQKRLLWARLNLFHPNASAREFAQRDLSAICRAVGVLTPRDSVDLHNLPLIIQVRCKKRKDTGEITNEIGGYVKRATAAPAAAPAAAPPSTAPWKRG